MQVEGAGRTLSEQTYQSLTDMIMEHEFSPGQKITEEQVAKSLSVSRTTVKKAFTALVNEGILEDIPRKGVFLKRYNRDEIREIYDLREVVAGLAARYAALNMTRRDLNRLEELYEEMKIAVDQGDMKAYAHCDRGLHEIIVNSSESAVLSETLGSFNLRLKSFVYSGAGDPKRTLLEHRDIIDALVSGIPEDAEDVMRIHIRKATEALD